MRTAPAEIMRDEMAVQWSGVMEYTKAAQEKGTDAVDWAVQLSAALASAGVASPSPELAQVLVSYLCWANDVPLAWKYIEKALSAGLVPPMVLLAFLSSRVIPTRHSRPAAYRLYLEILWRHAFSYASQVRVSNFKKIMLSIEDSLHLSEKFGVQASEPGLLVIEFIFYIVLQLLDATLDDEGLLELTPEKKFRWPIRAEDMDIDGEPYCQRNGYGEKLQKINSMKATELIIQFFQHKEISKLLSLARENMPTHWGSFSQRLHLLSTNSSTLQNSSVLRETLQQLLLDGFGRSCKSGRHVEFCAVIAPGCMASPGGHCHGATRSSLWIPIDLYLEDCIDGSVAATNAIEILSGLVKTLKAVNGTTWHDTFLGLWMASLRLVQREREPHEGPVPRLDPRLCILLSITTLAIADIIKEEEAEIVDEVEHSNQWKSKAVGGKCRQDLVSCLQILGDYESLLAPPPLFISAANQAAAKAMMFLSGLPIGSGYLECPNINDNAINLSGNLWHLIIESCISRKLVDTSAYFWPGYVSGKMKPMPHSLPGQVPGWSTLMKGAPLTPSLVNSLARSPASSLAELEKIFEVAINGSDDDKVSAAFIICSASLIRGWGIQEHTVRFVVKLLSPPVPVDYSGTDSHLICHGLMMNVVLTGISSVDCVQIFSFHGLVPELAGALMAICEVFGACVPNITWTTSGEEITAHSVFSNAFILLLRLWKFNHPPLEYCIMGDGAPVGSQLTPEYLLLLRNASLLSSCNSTKKRDGNSLLSTTCSSLPQPIFVDSFPKLKVWYRQHQACLASTLSGLVHGTPVHQNVDGLLNMMFRKINKGNNQSVGPGTSGSSLSNSSGPGSEDYHVKPMLPAWDIMEAVPFVVDAALSACSHGRLFPRELATGLKDLADFLPASLATIVSYFSAEVTRGVWKPAFMNGTDWPSPAANLSTVEEHIKKIVAATGVDVPSLVAGGISQATLPLPLAAFVSLTITYKLDKASERFLNLAGPALENLAASCPWPSMPIVAALWTQKVKRWSDFLVFSASRTVFHHNNDAIVQLLRSCFTATLGLSGDHMSSNGSVGRLLGHGFGSHFCGGLSPVAPGILYLRVYRCIKDIVLLTEDILSIMMQSVKEIADTVVSKEKIEKLKKTKHGQRYGQVSLATAMTRVKVAANLGATFVWLSGGSGLIQGLFQEMLPSWFLSAHELDKEGSSGGLVYILGGHALAYFTLLCGMFAWGIDTTSPSKRRPRVVEAHMEFLASALDGKISLGCDLALWRAYVSGFLGLVVECAASWVMEVNLGVVKRLSRGLRKWNQDDLALALLRKRGVEAMGAAAEVILACQW
ncbi:mediator of RNA polymerase II transcription subunit 33A isoform X1 [Dendrobium catenatum]|uniref:Mediator of RNA polymerase II transcription subunit 33A n=1 Tax=Dendrobium catenatum TaxID=906689 RepID=A0A2I0WQ86_9ASPA|nr:mediator of RNA polymerase II transcription subunit 33A isoform X1 [Dendrobium catenatum]PKU77796.1 Mediator of RNA polymerase II transcription subunit 33A [Dendrobium catenatum]